MCLLVRGLVFLAGVSILAQQPSGKVPPTNSVMDLTLSMLQQLNPPANAGVCSVPLIEMKIPEGTSFTMKELHPYQDEAVAKLSQVQPPAPPCGKAKPDIMVIFPQKK